MRRLPRLFFLRAIIILAFLGLAAGSSQAQSAVQIPPEWNRALDSLADKIAGAAKPARTFSLDVRNISSLNAGDIASLRQTLVEDLTSLGLSMTQRLPADSQLQLTLSESTGGYVWVAEIRRGDAHEVVMVSAARDVIKRANAREPSITLQRKLIWNEDARILDFGLVPDAVTNGAAVLVILEPDKIAFYEHQGAEWQLTREIAIAHERPAQRNVRGRINLQAGNAELPDAECNGEFQRPDTVVCTSRKGPRSYTFPSMPILVQGRSVEEYAVLALDCSVGPLALVTGPGDLTEPDYVQAYEGKNLAGPVSQQIRFAGPVIELWRDDDGKSVRVVSRNLQTGAYEASIVSVSCGD
jgi:hypothetical protein